MIRGQLSADVRDIRIQSEPLSRQREDQGLAHLIVQRAFPTEVTAKPGHSVRGRKTAERSLAAHLGFLRYRQAGQLSQMRM